MSTDKRPETKRVAHPLWQLTQVRIKAVLREPAALFWTFFFPLLTSLALGIAFRDKPPERLAVVVVEGPSADALAQALDKTEGLSAERATLPEGKERLRRGRVALVVVPGEPSPELLLDPTQPDSRVAKLMVADALQRLRGREDVLRIAETPVTAPGARYIDFLIPGLLGMGLMSSALWGIAYGLVTMRIGKLMKRLMGTPMKRSHFLLSFAASRGVFSIIDVLFFASFSRLLFGVRIQGGIVDFIVFGLLGAMAFLGLAMLAASRARTQETANGVINLVTMPMLFLSGVFFSADRFPSWSQPLIRALPLTALNDGLRAITNEGASLMMLGPQLLVLVLWGGLSFVIALRIFRWS